MIEKSATSREAGFESGLLSLNHTSSMILLVSFRPRNSYRPRCKCQTNFAIRTLGFACMPPRSALIAAALN